MYPVPSSGQSIRHVKLSPLTTNVPSTSDKAYLLFSDESNSVTICRGHTNQSSSAAAAAAADASGASQRQTLPVARSLLLSSSPRATAWCPFVTSTVEETGDSVLGLVTSSLGCPVQLRYFSDPLITAGSGDQQQQQQQQQVRDDDLAHDPNWVEASYKFFDNMDYPLCANTIEWHRNRANHIICGYDKGHIVVFDAEKPGRETAWRFQLNSIHSCKHKNGSGPQHSISALAVHDTQTHLVAVGTRGTGEVPIMDTRMRQAAMALRGGHGDSAAVTQLRFDPLCPNAVLSVSRGNAVTARAVPTAGSCAPPVWLAGVVQHDMRMPLAPSGLLRRPPCRASMQPVDFDLIAPADAERMRAALERSADSEVRQSQSLASQQQQQQQQIPDNLDQSSSVVVSGSGLSTIFAGQCVPLSSSSGVSSNPSQSVLQQQNDGDDNDDDDAWTHITSYSQDDEKSKQMYGFGQGPATAVAVCARRGILCCAGGERRYTSGAKNRLGNLDDSDDDAETVIRTPTLAQQATRRQRGSVESDDGEENDVKRIPNWQTVSASKPSPSSVLCRVYKF